MDKAYIYEMLDMSGQPFYVGKTVDPKTRQRHHSGNAKHGRRGYVYEKMRKLMQEGWEPSIRVVEEVPLDQIDERERYWIKFYREAGVKLTNLTEGGEGGCTSESAKKGAATRKTNGYAHSVETRRKISESSRGRVKSETHKESLKKSWVRTPEQLARASQKAAQTSKGRINTKVFCCVSPAGEKFVTEQGLTKFCEDRQISRFGFYRVLQGKIEHWQGWTITRMEG